jgi:NADH:ubiquinone oxidoreductase subunit K
MKDSIANITRWILYLLLALSVIPGVLFYADLLSTELFINWAKILLIVGVAVMVLSPIYGFITNPQNIIKMLISIAVMVVVIVIAYGFAGNDFTEYQLEELKTDAQTSTLVGLGLYATYITFGLTVVAIFYASITKIFK